MRRSIIITLSLLVAGSVQAGVSNGGGAKGVVCRNADRSIKSLELLDLYEGRVLYGLETKELGPDISTNLEVVAAKLSKNWDGWFHFKLENSVIAHAVNNLKLLPIGTKLLPVDDAAAIAVPENCALEQVAYYQDDHTLLVDQSLWNSMDVQNRAALFVHEGLFYSERIMGATDSRRTRSVVAHLFSDFLFTPVMSGIPKNALICHSVTAAPDRRQTTEFYMYRMPSSPRRRIFQFTDLGNKLAFSQLRAEIGETPKKGFVISFDVLSSFEAPTTMVLATDFDSRLHQNFDYFITSTGHQRITCTARTK